MIIDGKQIALEIFEDLKNRPVPDKLMAAVLIGENPASLSFLKQKEKAAKTLGIKFQLHKFSEDLSPDDLKQKLSEIAADLSVGGIILQLPLPDKFNREDIIRIIPESKDVDALNESTTRVLAPAAGVLKIILEKIGLTLKDKKIVVLGRGFLVGQPIKRWLAGRTQYAEVFGRDADPAKLEQALSKADLIITGVGKAGLVNPEMMKAGAAIIDFGYSTDDNGRIRGDFDSSSPALSSLSFYTPTPGGTGPVLVATLFKNFYELCK